MLIIPLSIIILVVVTGFRGFKRLNSNLKFPKLFSSTMASVETNPLLGDWYNGPDAQPYGIAPFGKIKAEHFKPAFTVGMKEHLDELRSIAAISDTEATFESVIAAFDRAGGTLDKVNLIFSNLCSTYNTPDLQPVQMDMSTILANHNNAVYTMPGLFEKLKFVATTVDKSTLSSEQLRLLDRFLLDFKREGADFDKVSKKEYGKIKERLAELNTQFQQNCMKDESEFKITLKLEDLSGCPDTLIEAARSAAKEADKAEDEYVITLSRSLVEPFLTFSDRRDLREKAWSAWCKRGELDPSRNNKAIAEEQLTLRLQQAKMHGYASFAHYQTADMMAKTPTAVNDLLENVWNKAKVSANKEREALEEYIKETNNGESFTIEAWDWRYYAEKVRQSKFNFDESALKPYFSLEKITTAVFETAFKLYGLTYHELPDVELYHPDAKLYEVKEGDKLIALFIHDNYARQYKSSGAWMSEYRGQTKNVLPSASQYEGIPIISNNNNFAKAENTLLSFDDAITLFHEFGHGLHGTLSNTQYGRLAGTNVLTDFVELPSQLMEHWVKSPEVIRTFTHYLTGESIPEDLITKLQAARNFNQGFATIEYTACALLDQIMHQKDNYEGFDILQFEAQELERLGMPQGIIMRHRPPHFQHLFSTSHYAAGYFVYLWAEVLDADAFDAFVETGDIFDKATATKCREFIYSAGNRDDPAELFRQFRGRDPTIEPMLKKKGLLAEA